MNERIRKFVEVFSELSGIACQAKTNFPNYPAVDEPAQPEICFVELYAGEDFSDEARLAYVCFSPDWYYRSCYLNEVWIAESFRRRGFGSMVIGLFEDLLRELNFTEITGNVIPKGQSVSNQAFIDFFKKNQYIVKVVDNKHRRTIAEIEKKLIKEQKKSKK